MNNVLIDDRQIKVDFSQSTALLRKQSTSHLATRNDIADAIKHATALAKGLQQQTANQQVNQHTQHLQESLTDTRLSNDESDQRQQRKRIKYERQHPSSESRRNDSRSSHFRLSHIRSDHQRHNSSHRRGRSRSRERNRYGSRHSDYAK